MKFLSDWRSLFAPFRGRQAIFRASAIDPFLAPGGPNCVHYCVAVEVSKMWPLKELRRRCKSHAPRSKRVRHMSLFHHPPHFEVLGGSRDCCRRSPILRPAGPGPYLLTGSNTNYVLDTDVTVNGTAFILGGKNVTLDLNGHTVTYGNRAPVSVANGGFEQGSGRTVPGWNLTNAPDAAIGANDLLLLGQPGIEVHQPFQERVHPFRSDFDSRGQP